MASPVAEVHPVAGGGSVGVNGAGVGFYRSGPRCVAVFGVVLAAVLLGSFWSRGVRAPFALDLPRSHENRPPEAAEVACPVMELVANSGVQKVGG